MDKLIIVDENDVPIGLKDRSSVTKDDIYRVSALWITNSKGDILLAQRQLTKKQDPGKWGPAVAGTNDEGESYDVNILKEAQEEIGLKNTIFTIARKIRYTSPTNNFCQWYTLVIDKDIDYFKLQEEEVKAIKWFTRDELKKQLSNSPEKFLVSVKACLEEF